MKKDKNSKEQIPNNFQFPKFKFQTVRDLEFGI